MKTNEEKIRQTVFFLKPVLEWKVRTMEVLTLWWQHTPDKNKQKKKKKKKNKQHKLLKNGEQVGPLPPLLTAHCCLRLWGQVRTLHKVHVTSS